MNKQQIKAEYNRALEEVTEGYPSISVELAQEQAISKAMQIQGPWLAKYSIEDVRQMVTN